MAEELEFLWENCPAISRTRSGKRKLQAAWNKILKAQRPSLELLETALTAWKATAKWSEGYAEGIHIWVNNRQWENIPDAAPDNSKEETEDLQFGGRKGKVHKIS